jgi:SPP1 family predicted phage head-tail adaptor
MMKLKDKKIEILQPVIDKDPEGFGAEILVPIAPPLWAYFRQLSGKEIYANATTTAVEQVMFIVNYRADLSTAFVVRFKEVLYDITRVDVYEGYKGDITLYCKLRGADT